MHLEERPRLDKVLAKLKAETAQGSVIALQEVTRGWAGHLHTFFARAGYHFVHCELLALAFFGGEGKWNKLPSLHEMERTALASQDSHRLHQSTCTAPWPKPPFNPAGYSRPASGYMGIGLAWPTADVEAVSVEISRLADAKARS